MVLGPGVKLSIATTSLGFAALVEGAQAIGIAGSHIFEVGLTVLLGLTAWLVKQAWDDLRGRLLESAADRKELWERIRLLEQANRDQKYICPMLQSDPAVRRAHLVEHLRRHDEVYGEGPGL